jgi:hypothetical protein
VQTELRQSDFIRFHGQRKYIFELMADGQWRTLEEIAKRCNASEAGASARLRDFRKQAYGGFTVRRRRVSGTNIYEYQLDLAD